MNSSTARPVFMTPLQREDLLEPDVVFAREELTRRVLSFFWRDCCQPACFSRAPAPVVELAPQPSPGGTPPARIRAWWLLEDGIVEEHEGAYSERLRPFFGGIGRTGQLWPRYEYQFLPQSLELRMNFFREPLAAQGQQIRLEAVGEADVRVVERQVSWNK